MRRRIGTIIALVMAGLAMAGATAWGALVLFYLGPGSGGVRTLEAWSFVAIGLVALGALTVRRARRPAVIGFAAAFALVLVVWGSATPLNDRDWQPEVAVLPYATIDGDRVTVHNIRNFDYRTETDFTPPTMTARSTSGAWTGSIWSPSTGWARPSPTCSSPSASATITCAISIEARKDRTRPYSTLPGFFRQYELVYIVADERDVIRVRTNYRTSPPEDVYLFRVMGPIENGRRIFLDYLRDINELREHPRFYNTLTTNCTTMILTHAAVNPGHIPYSWKVLLSGYAPEYAYERGRLDQSLPFEELKRRAHINAAARAADQAPDFSRRIRVGLP